LIFLCALEESASNAAGLITVIANTAATTAVVWRFTLSIVMLPRSAAKRIYIGFTLPGQASIISRLTACLTLSAWGQSSSINQ
jgi:hypothetical protein